MRTRIISRLICLSALSISLTGCLLGPNFHSPRAPVVSRYTDKPLSHRTVQVANAGQAGKSQTFIIGEDLPHEWWRLFHSPAINMLVTAGIANSPDLAAAYATIRQAQENLNVQIGNLLFPSVTLQANAQRQLLAGSSFGNDIPSTLFNIFNTSVNVSYVPDVFGASRRTIEAYDAQVDFQKYEMLAVYITLTSNIVTTAITVASLEAQIEASYEIVAAQQGQLDILNKQFQLGGISRENVLTQETQVAQARATIPPLQKSLSQARHALAVLIGAFPDTPLPHIDLDQLNLPRDLPVSLPSRIVRQRPDVLAAEATLHVASAQIGVAIANLFPQFTLTAQYGWQSSVLSSLFQPNNKFWSYGLQILQPVFKGGALQAQRRAAIAAYEQACAKYRQTVLQAFQNVADSLRALEADARTLKAQKLAEVAARRNFDLTREQYRLGGSSYLNLLTVQRAYQQTRIAVIQARAARYSDTAALFQALGGGWWNRIEGFCRTSAQNKQLCL